MSPRRSWRRLVAPAALFLGLALFGVTLLTLGGAASNDAVTRLEPSFLGVVNGTASMIYPTDYYGYSKTSVDATFSFPEAAGNASFVGCTDRDRALSGQPPAHPLVAYNAVRGGTLHVSRQTVGPYSYRLLAPDDRYLDDSTCYTGALLFQWAAPDGKPEANKPVVEATFLDDELDEGAGVFLLVLSVGGALLALLGGLAWARQSPQVAEDDDESLPDSTAESLRFALDRMGGQLERTRRNLLLAGVVGIFLWYPILVPWVWTTASGDTNATWLPWALAGAALLFLGVLTVLWAREFVRLDRELRRWRERMGELRDREAGLMADLEGR